MSGLIEAVTHDRGPRWFPQRESQTLGRPVTAAACCGFPHVSDRPIAICSFPCKVRYQRGRFASFMLSRCADPSGGGGRNRGSRVGPVSLAAHHELPGDACDLVGQRHGHEFRRLAPKQIQELGRRLLAAPLPDPPKKGGGPDDQSAAQGLVARARDDAEPDLAGRRVVLRCQPKPCCELASGSE